MNLELNNKVAIIAASTEGLGFATAKELAKEGAKVVICGRTQELLNKAIKKLNEITDPNKILGVCIDLTASSQIEQLVKETVNQFGGIDILITNAGGPPTGIFSTSKLEEFEKAFQLTLMSAVRLIHFALPYLRQSKAPSILTITSVSAKQPIPGLLQSNIFRPAVIGFTKHLSQELGRENIRVNSILPGFTATDRTNALLAKWAEQRGSSIEQEKQKRAEAVPLGRMGKPEEFAKVAAFLVSPAASYLSGVMLQVDGGAYTGLL